MVAVPTDRSGQVDTYGVEMTLNHVGVLEFRGYDWVVEMEMRTFLEKLGVPAGLADKASREASYRRMLVMVEGNERTA